MTEDKYAPINVPAGESIIEEGVDGDRMYRIESGSFSVTRKGQEVGELGAGHYLGLIGVLEGETYEVTCTATTDAVVTPIDEYRFKFQLQENPMAGLDAIRHLSAILRMVIRHLETRGEELGDALKE